MSNNPNASVAVVAGAITTIVVWLIGLFTSVDIPAEVSAAFTTVDIAAILYFGKNRRNAPQTG